MPTPGLVGRLYLFGPEIDFPLPADGALTVDLYVAPPDKPDGALTHLEQWRIDKETLKWSRIEQASKALSYSEITRACEESIKEMLIHDLSMVTNDALVTALTERRLHLNH